MTHIDREPLLTYMMCCYYGMDVAEIGSGHFTSLHFPLFDCRLQRSTCRGCLVAESSTNVTLNHTSEHMSGLFQVGLFTMHMGYDRCQLRHVAHKTALAGNTKAACFCALNPFSLPTMSFDVCQHAGDSVGRQHQFARFSCFCALQCSAHSPCRLCEAVLPACRKRHWQRTKQRMPEKLWSGAASTMWCRSCEATSGRHVTIHGNSAKVLTVP